MPFCCSACVTFGCGGHRDYSWCVPRRSSALLLPFFVCSPSRCILTLRRDTGSRYSWYGAAPVGLDRARILSELESLPGPQLAIVAYAPHHMLNDWVYNAADIDKSKVIWARQMDPASDRELLNYYKGRQAWLVEPDCNPPRISPFPGSDFPQLVNTSLSTIPGEAQRSHGRGTHPP